MVQEVLIGLLINRVKSVFVSEGVSLLFIFVGVVINNMVVILVNISNGFKEVLVNVN